MFVVSAVYHVLTTLRKWHRRYLQEGLNGLIGKSKKPHCSPNKIVKLKTQSLSCRYCTASFCNCNWCCAKSNAKCNDTILGEIAKNIEFNYYHCKPDRYGIVKMTDHIVKSDTRFTTISKKFKKTGAEFSSDATFLRGCVSISCKSE